MLTRRWIPITLPVLLMAPAGTAWAVESGAGSEIRVTTDGYGYVDTTIAVPGSPGSSSSTARGSPTAGQTSTSSASGGGGGPSCTYTLDGSNPAGHGADYPGLDSVDFSQGAYYVRYCSSPAGDTLNFVWVPNGTTPGNGGGAAVPVVTPQQLAQEAYNSLRLPDPRPGINPEPGEGRYQLVNLPTWWWVENWEPVSQRTEAGPVWAEVTATPVANRFDGGDDGDGARCGGAGVVWRRTLPEDYPPACTYTYQRAANSYDASIRVTWRVTWVGSGGTGGTLPQMTTSTTVPLTVYERQTVVVNGRG